MKKKNKEGYELIIFIFLCLLLKNTNLFFFFQTKAKTDNENKTVESRRRWQKNGVRWDEMEVIGISTKNPIKWVVWWWMPYAYLQYSWLHFISKNNIEYANWKVMSGQKAVTVTTAATIFHYNLFFISKVFFVYSLFLRLSTVLSAYVCFYFVNRC